MAHGLCFYFSSFCLTMNVCFVGLRICMSFASAIILSLLIITFSVIKQARLTSACLSSFFFSFQTNSFVFFFTFFFSYGITFFLCYFAGSRDLAWFFRLYSDLPILCNDGDVYVRIWIDVWTSCMCFSLPFFFFPKTRKIFQLKSLIVDLE